MMKRLLPREVIWLCLVLIFTITSFSCISKSPYRITPVAKKTSDLYHEARRADVLGFTPTASLSQGYIRKVDIAKALLDSQEKRELEKDPEEEETLSSDESWFENALDRYSPEIDDVWEEEYQSTYLAPLEDTRLRLVYVDEHIRFENDRGRDYSKGLNLFLSNRSSARLFNRFLITAEPEFSFHENGRNQSQSDDEAFNLRFKELTGAMRFGPAEWTVGRTPLWWGPGRHGSLLLSNNARPFDLVKVGSAGPQLLPGFLEHLGFIQGEVFVARLDSARSVKRPYLAGMRVSSRILPWLELGANRTAQFGGGDRSVTRSTLWEVATAQTENDQDDPGNQIGSIDVRIIVPWETQPFELYSEIGGEDEAGAFFSKRAYLAGLYLPRIGSLDWLELNIEFATTEVSGEPRLWYTNRNYPDGYTFHDQVIGHHMGTDALDIYFELRMKPVEDWSFLISYDYEEHFRQESVTETLQQFRLGVSTKVVDRLEVIAKLGIDLWENFQQIDGQDEQGHFLELGAHWQF